MTKRDERMLLGAAEELVQCGFLARENDARYAGVCVDGHCFSYLARIWEATGVLVRDADGPGWRTTIVLPLGEDAAVARLELAAVWIAAGAPPTWARAEADAALRGDLFVELMGEWLTA